MSQCRSTHTHTCTHAHTHTQPSGSVNLEDGPTEPVHSLQFMSDGMFIYWMYAQKSQETVPHPVTGEKIKQHPVYVHTLELKVRRGLSPNW